MEGVAVHRVMQADNRFFIRSVDNQQPESRHTRSAQTTLELREKNGEVAVIWETSRPDPPGGGSRLVPHSATPFCGKIARPAINIGVCATYGN
jgi:hypothetical protein